MVSTKVSNMAMGNGRAVVNNVVAVVSILVSTITLVLTQYLG